MTKKDTNIRMKTKDKTTLTEIQLFTKEQMKIIKGIKMKTNSLTNQEPDLLTKEIILAILEGGSRTTRELYKEVNAIRKVFSKWLQQEREICKKIYIDHVDWAEWAITDEEAGELFDEYRKEHKQT